MAKRGKQKLKKLARKEQAKKEVAAQATAGTTLMSFTEDKIVRGAVLYPKGQVCEVPNRSVDRWLKRGGVIVSNETPAERTKRDHDEKIQSAVDSGQLVEDSEVQTSHGVDDLDLSQDLEDVEELEEDNF